MAAMFHLPRIRRERHYRGFNPFNKDFSDEQLRQRYRFGRETIEFLANELRGDLERNTSKKTALTVEQQVMIALRFFVSRSQMQVVGDTMGFDNSTVSRVVSDVTDALVARKEQYIKWPTEEQKNVNKHAFYDKAGFRNIIGCIDGTHVHIQAPTEDEPAYVNRKDFHSVNVQVICDHQGTINNKINANVKWPGSAHDAHVFRTSAIGRHLENNYQGIEQGLLLGDSGYPCRPFLLTPYRQPANRMQGTL
ncbi:HARBI1 [Mytilus coruscus]|uniref:Putative nuclease HARBI1 n=1 Tax=Mytilus coruscus TaxID=42192 RepID=A0A6J8F219_MYTCO|nr:HARBI1 [Mytilus coruscus]